jgi:hypothetical protein
VVVLTCFVIYGCVYVWVLCVWVCVCVGFVMCGYLDSCVAVFVICVLEFIVFCIVYTVFLYRIVYVYLFLFVLLPPSENSIAVSNNYNNNNNNNNNISTGLSGPFVDVS